jgi:hypothetical protein
MEGPAAMAEAALRILMRAARRLHDAIERHEGGGNDLSHLISPELAGAWPRIASFEARAGAAMTCGRPLLLTDTSNGETPDRQHPEKNFVGLRLHAAPVSCLPGRIG